MLIPIGIEEIFHIDLHGDSDLSTLEVLTKCGKMEGDFKPYKKKIKSRAQFYFLNVVVDYLCQENVHMIASCNVHIDRVYSNDLSTLRDVVPQKA